MRLLYAFVSPLLALQVSALAFTPNTPSPLVRRGPCDTACDRYRSISEACSSDHCYCSTSTYNSFNDCLTCMMSNVDESQDLIGEFLGGTTSTTDAGHLEEAQQMRTSYVDACAAEGYPITTSAPTSSSTRSGGPSPTRTISTTSSVFRPGGGGGSTPAPPDFTSLGNGAVSNVAFGAGGALAVVLGILPTLF